jgi:hypothetical protein
MYKRLHKRFQPLTHRVRMGRPRVVTVRVGSSLKGRFDCFHVLTENGKNQPRILRHRQGYYYPFNGTVDSPQSTLQVLDTVSSPTANTSATCTKSQMLQNPHTHRGFFFVESVTHYIVPPISRNITARNIPYCSEYPAIIMTAIRPRIGIHHSSGHTTHTQGSAAPTGIIRVKPATFGAMILGFQHSAFNS